MRLLPERAAVRLAAIPYALEGRGVRVAFKNPSNLAAVDEVSAVTNRPVVPAVISEVRLLQAFHLFYGRPIPIEFRSVLNKLERNEERRLYRTRATIEAPAPSADPARETPARSREIRIETGAPRPETARPISFAAPFSSAEQPTRELADVADFLPDFEPAHAPTPDELADGMWRDPEAEAAAQDAEVRSMWGRQPEAAAPAADRSPARDRLAESTLETVCARFPRALLMMSGHDAVQGWTARGGGLTRDRISRVRVPWGEPSIFAFVKLSGSPHRGALLAHPRAAETRRPPG